MDEKNKRQVGNPKVEAFFERGGNIVAATYRAVIRDGAIGNSLNHARSELASALKAFPDAVHERDYQSVQSPNPQEAHATAEKPKRKPLTPSEIAKAKDSRHTHDEWQKAQMKQDKPGHRRGGQKL